MTVKLTSIELEELLTLTSNRIWELKEAIKKGKTAKQKEINQEAGIDIEENNLSSLCRHSAIRAKLQMMVDEI